MPVYFQALNPDIVVPEALGDDRPVKSILFISLRACKVGDARGILNVEVIGMHVGNFFGEPKKYPEFDFKPLQNTQIAILRAVLGKMASIFQKFSTRP